MAKWIRVQGETFITGSCPGANTPVGSVPAPENPTRKMSGVTRGQAHKRLAAIAAQLPVNVFTRMSKAAAQILYSNPEASRLSVRITFSCSSMPVRLRAFHILQFSRSQVPRGFPRIATMCKRGFVVSHTLQIMPGWLRPQKPAHESLLQ